MVDIRINWTFLKSVNTTNEHSQWHKLKVYATKDVHLFVGFTINDPNQWGLRT